MKKNRMRIFILARVYLLRHPDESHDLCRHRDPAVIPTKVGGPPAPSLSGYFWVPFCNGMTSVLGSRGIGIDWSFFTSLFVHYFLKSPRKTPKKNSRKTKNYGDKGFGAELFGIISLSDLCQPAPSIIITIF